MLWVCLSPGFERHLLCHIQENMPANTIVACPHCSRIPPFPPLYASTTKSVPRTTSSFPRPRRPHSLAPRGLHISSSTPRFDTETIARTTLRVYSRAELSSTHCHL